MTTKVFSISEALHFGWNTTKSNLGIIIGFFITISVIFRILSIISNIAPENIFLGVILSIITAVLLITVMMGMIKTALRLYDQEKARFSDFFSQYHLFFSYLFATFLWGLITWAGLILLIIPGIIWGIKYFFCDYFVIDKKSKPIEAFKQSAAITRGIKWQLFVFFVVIGLISILGTLPHLISLFVTFPAFMLVLDGLLLSIVSFITIPITILATAFVYRKLLAQTEIATASQIVPQVSSQAAPEATA